MCLSEMMRIDAAGGAGVDSRENRERLEYEDRHMQRGDTPPGASPGEPPSAPRPP
jgi:cytochrome o ubiquinol oxidase subunit 2